MGCYQPWNNNGPKPLQDIVLGICMPTLSNSGLGQALNALFISFKNANKIHFRLAMEKIKKVKIIGIAAHTWLSEIHPSQWSRLVFDTTSKIVRTTNNCIERFNAWIDTY